MKRGRVEATSFLAGFLFAFLTCCWAAADLSDEEKSSGFASLFDGKTLRGWEGSSRYWKAEGGKLVYLPVKKVQSSRDLLELKLLSEKQYSDYAQTFSHGWQLPALLKGGEGKGIPRDARYKPGSGGQLIAFVPSLDLVITRQTGSSGNWEYEEYLRRACAAVLPDAK